MPPDYRQRIHAPAWLVALLVSTLVGSAIIWIALREAFQSEAPGVAWIWDLIWIPTIALMPAILLFFGRLEIRVGRTDLALRFGYVPVVAKSIPLRFIHSAESVRYRPIRQFGGWGIRWGTLDGARTAVYSIRGSTGVLLTLAAPIAAGFVRTDRILIGSDDSDGLADALARAR
jgi:hypothetical protein